MTVNPGPLAHARWQAERRAGLTGPRGDLALLQRQPVNWTESATRIADLPVTVFRVPGETGVRVPTEAADEVAIDGEPVAGAAFLGRASSSGGPLLTWKRFSVEAWLVDGENYELRIYDADRAARLGFDRVDAFDFDPAWVCASHLDLQTRPPDRRGTR